jgi:acetate kinase
MAMEVAVGKMILVLNAGSSSHKCALFSLEDNAKGDYSSPIWSGKLDWTEVPGSVVVQVRTNQGYTWDATLSSLSVKEALKKLINTLWQGEGRVLKDPSQIQAVGHRVVHGGSIFRQPALITEKVKTTIKDLIPLAPLHNPANLEGIQIMENLLPAIPHIAVFDTAFHRNIPEIASTYPIPADWRGEGIIRYGFHGISHEYCANRVAHLMGRDIRAMKIITCHIGNGSSLTAIRNGKSVDTTMGFTPMEGLMMGSRSGSIDPGILLYLLREKKVSADDLDKRLNFQSGLKGIAGSSDMREIEKKMSENDKDAKLAFDMYVYRFKSALGALLANLGGLDALVFTGGIGENSIEFRSAACSNLDFLGILLDGKANAEETLDCKISKSDSEVSIWAIKTREEWEIGKQSLGLC